MRFAQIRMDAMQSKQGSLGSDEFEVVNVPVGAGDDW